jgi:hypothetical protein
MTMVNSSNDSWYDLLHGLLKIRKWGILQKDQVDNIDEWAA